MQKVYIDKTNSFHKKPNSAVVAEARKVQYECTKYCRNCPFPGLKCCEDPYSDNHMK